MIDALLSGRIYGRPKEGTSRNGNTYVTAKLRVTAGETSNFCSVITFAESVKSTLLALGDGDSVALAGELSVGTYVVRDGSSAISLDLKAHAALTPYHVTRKRKAVAAAITVSEPNDFDDDLP